MPVPGGFAPAPTGGRVAVVVGPGGSSAKLLVLLVFGVLLVFDDVLLVLLSIGHGERDEDGMVWMRRTADTATKGSLLPGLRVNVAGLSQNGYGPHSWSFYFLIKRRYGFMKWDADPISYKMGGRLGADHPISYIRYAGGCDIPLRTEPWGWKPLS